MVYEVIIQIFLSAISIFVAIAGIAFAFKISRASSQSDNNREAISLYYSTVRQIFARNLAELCNNISDIDFRDLALRAESELNAILDAIIIPNATLFNLQTRRSYMILLNDFENHIRRVRER